MSVAKDPFKDGPGDAPLQKSVPVFLLKAVTSQIGSSMSRPTCQRNNRL